MKKGLFILLFVSISSFELLAQRKFFESYEKGIILLDLHSSLGLYRNRNFVTQRIPVFIGADYGLDKNISLGAFGGWSQRTFKDPNFPAYDVNYYYYGGRVSFHLTEFLREKTIIKFNPKYVDIYGTIWFGRQVARQLSFVGSTFIDPGGVSIYGTYAGVRVYTMYSVGVLVEFGAGPFGIFNVGICTKF